MPLDTINHCALCYIVVIEGTVAPTGPEEVTMSYYSAIEKNLVARRLVDEWFNTHIKADMSMWQLLHMDTEEGLDRAADAYDEEIYAYYGARACAALGIDSDDLYVAIAYRYGF